MSGIYNMFLLTAEANNAVIVSPVQTPKHSRVHLGKLIIFVSVGSLEGLFR